MPANEIRATGGCLCGSVRYEVRGALMPVINCHCSKCRRFHGHAAAYTATRRENLILIDERGLAWYRSVQDETPDVYRGFCRECGSSLFWDPRGKLNISIAAGSIDPPTGLFTERHVWVSQKTDYYVLTDGIPQHDERFARADYEQEGSNP
ncbi:MAG: GFA family protein [Desulfobacterales bacterium]